MDANQRGLPKAQQLQWGMCWLFLEPDHVIHSVPIISQLLSHRVDCRLQFFEVLLQLLSSLAEGQGYQGFLRCGPSGKCECQRGPSFRQIHFYIILLQANGCTTTVKDSFCILPHGSGNSWPIFAEPGRREDQTRTL